MCVCDCTYCILLAIVVFFSKDPDAPTREGKHLAELDEKDEQSLVRHLFTCVRAGQLAKVR